MHKSIVRIAQAIGQLHGAGVEIDLTPGTPPVVNTPEITPVAREAALKVVGEERVLLPAHSSRFDFDERALATGAAWFVEVAKAAGKYLEKE
jgi:metal-dependent amidase/aminoacylase/carboxypeptidase family protein